MAPATVAKLPHALDRKRLASALDGRRPAVFLDYDGVLTPIVERPQDAVMSPGMRETVSALAARCPVCIVSGRDRATVQQLMGLDALVVAGSHGFDIRIPGKSGSGHGLSAEYRELIARVTEQLSAAVAELDGVRIERKHASVAVHYRQAGPDARARVQRLVDSVLTAHPGRLKVMPGKMVAEIQPGIDWDKGAAVRYLLQVLALDSPDIVALYLGDDITDEDAFRALHGVGIGIVVGRPDDPEVADRATGADFALASTDEVQRFLATLAS